MFDSFDGRQNRDLIAEKAALQAKVDKMIDGALKIGKERDAALLEVEGMRKALLEIKAKLERSHDGGCILPLRDMVNDALGEGVAENRNQDPRKEEPRFWNCCGKLVVSGDSAHPYGCQKKRKYLCVKCHVEVPENVPCPKCGG